MNSKFPIKQCVQMKHLKMCSKEGNFWALCLMSPRFLNSGTSLPCLFVSIHGSLDKQRKNGTSWQCFATSLINAIPCTAACFWCSARVWGLFGCAVGGATTGPDILAPSSSDECLRERSWGGTAPRSQMFVKNRHVSHPVRETNGLGGWDRCTACSALAHNDLY